MHEGDHRCRGRARRGRGDRPPPRRGRTRPRGAPRGRGRRRGRGPRAGGPPAERRLRDARPPGAALRGAEVRGVARRQDRGRRRLVEVDHVARGPRRCAAPACVGGRGRGRIADRTRGRPGPHRSRALAWPMPGRPCGSSWTPGAASARRAASSTRPRPTLVATTDHATEGRIAEWEAGGRPGGGAAARHAPAASRWGRSSRRWASETCRDSWSRAVGPSRGRSCAMTWSTGWSLYLAPKLLGGSPRRPGSCWVAGSRPSTARDALAFERVDRVGPRPQGGGAMFTGIVEERGTVEALEGSRLVVRCRTVTGGCRRRRVDRGERRVSHRGRRSEPDLLGFDLVARDLRPLLPRTAPARRPGQPRASGDPRGAPGWAPRPGARGRGRRGHGRRPRPRGRRAAHAAILPDGLGRYVVEKGSITVDGVSLTVAALLPTGSRSP